MFVIGWSTRLVLSCEELLLIVTDVSITCGNNINTTWHWLWRRLPHRFSSHTTVLLRTTPTRIINQLQTSTHLGSEFSLYHIPGWIFQKVSTEIGQKASFCHENAQLQTTVTSVCLLQNWCAFLQKTGNWKIFLLSYRNFSRPIFLFSQNAKRITIAWFWSAPLPVISCFTLKKHAISVLNHKLATPWNVSCLKCQKSCGYSNHYEFYKSLRQVSCWGGGGGVGGGPSSVSKLCLSPAVTFWKVQPDSI